MTGAANKVQLHVITNGAPDTIATTPTLACTQLISTNFDGMIAKKSVTVAFETDQMDDDMLTALKLLVGITEPTEATKSYYEDGVLSGEGSASSSVGIIRSVMVKYGSDLSATKIHVAIGSGWVTQASWAHTTKFEETTKPALEYKTLKQAVGNTIAIAAGVWDALIVQTTAPTPALPTTIGGDTYGNDYSLQKA